MATATKLLIPVLSVVLAASAGVCAPQISANTGMTVGNYELLSNRWNDNSWVWTVTHSCGAPNCGTYTTGPLAVSATDNLNVIANPRPAMSEKFQNTAFYRDGRYTLAVDVVDGVRCFGQNLPSHDEYSWDATNLAGTVVSTFNADCFGGPGGSRTYTFALQRQKG